MDPKALVRLMTALCVLLAAMCVWLAMAGQRAREEALCWRAFVEDDERPPEGDCRRL